jgi:voltage-gated potassium channel
VPEESSLRRRVRLLYTGRSETAEWFRYGLIAFDVATILYFVATAALPEKGWVTIVDVALGVLILFDFSARMWIAPRRLRALLQIYTLADLVVVASLLLAPFLHLDVAFLRILRGLRLLHSYHLVRDLRRESAFFRRHEDAIYAGVNLFVFIFVTTSMVYVVGFEERTGYAAYIDALYFTVATLTTTGFGDITMTTPGGKLLSVFIMVVGVALFVQLARAVFRPPKVRYTCPGCGLERHDPDAIHCKHCGESLRIRTEGADGA